MQQRPNPTGRRPMTRREYEALQSRRKQNIIAIGILAAVAAVIIVAVVLILAPKKSARDVAVQTVSAAATAVPAEISSENEAGESASAEDAPSEVVPLDSETGNGGDDADGRDAAIVEETPEPVSTPRPEGLRSVRMRVVGDVMVCESQLKAYASTGYDFHPELSYVTEYLQNADYTMANMEGTVGKYNSVAYSGYPMFNCPETILDVLKDNGVDFLTLANNHMLDRWFNGMKNTVGWVEQYGFDHVGAYRTQQERNTPAVYEVNGIKIGFVAYTHTTNTMEKACDPEAVEYGVPYLYKANIEEDIKRVRDAGAEVVIAFPHWGKEYIRQPDSNQVKYAKRLAVAGADIIIGSHSHMVQPMGYQYLPREDGSQRQIFIMFSMGNFLSDHTKQYCDCGIILDFTINENTDGTFTCDDVGYIPTYTWQPAEGDARVLASGQFLDKAPAGMSDEAYRRMVASYHEVVEVIGDEFPVLDS